MKDFLLFMLSMLPLMMLPVVLTAWARRTTVRHVLCVLFRND